MLNEIYPSKVNVGTHTELDAYEKKALSAKTSLEESRKVLLDNKDSDFAMKILF